MRDDKVTIDTTWVKHWQPQFIGTLLFLRQDDHVLLIHKKTGHGAGRINAPGGKLDPGEGVVACACRETFEEVGLQIGDARVGMEMRFVERDGPTATVSHELRNPLGTLLSSISVVRKYLKNTDPPVQEELDRMQRNIWRCAHIIEDLLEFSRNKEIRSRAVQIDNWIATQVMEQTVPEFVQLKTDFQSGATVLIDSEKFRQAIVNIIQNAHQAIALRDDKASPEGILTISTRTRGKQVELRIVDDGCGISPEDAGNIFKPLFSTKAFGVGLGLPLVQRIVERHDGDITVQSDLGKGTVVTIWLPVVRKETAEKSSRAISS